MNKDDLLKAINTAYGESPSLSVGEVIKIVKIIEQHFSISGYERRKASEWIKKAIKRWERQKEIYPGFILPEIYPHLKVALKVLENK